MELPQSVSFLLITPISSIPVCFDAVVLFCFFDPCIHCQRKIFRKLWHNIYLTIINLTNCVMHLDFRA